LNYNLHKFPSYSFNNVVIWPFVSWKRILSICFWNGEDPLYGEDLVVHKSKAEY